MLHAFLIWFGPPLLGALVGWLFTLLAARLVLRRLRAPSSPLAVRGRAAIAHSLGRLAAQSVSAKDALRRVIQSEGTAEQVLIAVSGVTARLAAMPISTVGAFVATLPLQETLARFLRQLPRSRAAIHAIRDIVSSAIETLSARRMQDVVRQLGLAALLRDTLLPFLGSEANRGTLSASLGFIVAGQAGSVLSNELIEELSAVIDPYVPAVADRLVLWMQSAETRAYMAEKGRVLLPQILEKLNAVQKLLIGAGQFDRRLNEKMPEIIDETVKTLESIVRDPVQQRSIIRLLITAAEDWRDGLLVTRVASGPSSSDPRRQLGQAVGHLTERLLASLEDAQTRSSLSAALESWLTGGSQTVGGFLRSLGVRDVDMAESLSARTLSWLTQPETAKSVSHKAASIVTKLLDEHAQETVGEVLAIDAARKKALDGFASSRIVKLAAEHAMDIIEKLDVEAKVAKLVQGIDLGSVLDTGKGSSVPMRWIALFGAAAGLLAGLSQLLLRLVAP